MRHLTIAALIGVVGCAQPGLPPGGPEDTAAPRIVRISPDTNATNVRSDGIRFDFDEVVSERPTGAPGLAELFLISPSWGDNRVSWRRNTVTVAPRGGLRGGTTYTVRMLPGLVDLDGNSDSTGMTLVFSTGPSVSRGHMRGIVFDWFAEKVGKNALIEAFPIPTSRDSIRYLTVADSLGRFDLGNLPNGRYLLRAVIDQNTNRLLDPRELYDSATVALTDSLRREMLAIVRDTLGPSIQTITVVDSVTLRVALDHLLDPAKPIGTESFTVQGGDSAFVPVASVVSSKAFEKQKEDSTKAKAATDSAARADSIARVDSGRAARDTVRRPRTDSALAAAAAPPPARSRLVPPPRPRRADAPRAVAGQAARDTVEQDSLPKPSVAPPINEVVIKLARALEPGKGYRLRSVDLRSYLGRERSAQRSFTTPKARAEKDSTERDSTGRRDSVRLRPRGPDTLRRPRVRDTLTRDTTRRDTLVRDTIGRATSASAYRPPFRPLPPR